MYECRSFYASNWIFIICLLIIAQFSSSEEAKLFCFPHDVSVQVGRDVDVTLFLTPYNDTVELFPMYEPVSASDKVIRLGNITVQGKEDEGLNFSVSIHALRGGHVTVYWNASKPEIKDLEAYVRLTIIHYNEVFVICIVVGWMYFAAWSISFYPQIYENFKRKSVVGLSLDFVAINILGHSVYGLFNFGLYWIPSVQLQYYELYPMGIIPVQINDVVFSAHAIVLSFLAVIQCLIYEKGTQKVTNYAWGFIIISTAFIFFSTIAAAAGGITWLSLLYYCSYVKLVVTLIKYIPQAYMNYLRQSTVGYSIGGVLLDMAGGLLSILQMFLLAYNNDDWDSLFGDPTKFGLGFFSVCFDLLFIVQHYVLYRNTDPHVMLINGD